MKVPQHIAIILDGNGRWAKAKGMPRNYGHAQGSKNVERICAGGTHDPDPAVGEEPVKTD